MKNILILLLNFILNPSINPTCKALGEKYNISPQSFNGIITNFAKAVQKKLNRFEVIGTEGTPSYWIIPMTGKYVGEFFEWTIRPELVEALNEIKYKWNNKMNYWHLQMCLPQGRGGLKINSMDMLQNTLSVIGTGEWDSYQCRKFKGSMKKGDIVCVKEGQQAVALCEIVGDNFNDQVLENQFLHHNYRTVNLLDTNPPDRDFPQPQGTLSIARDKNTSSWQFINEWYNSYKQKQSMGSYISLLKSNQNLVLTGAPGTGKTYLAKEIAKQIIGVENDEELEDCDQYAFVQFHPSYDYTDFVDGLRPTKPDVNGDIGFELKNGIFKDFCEKAIGANAITSSHSSQSSKIDRKELFFVFIIDEINRGEISKIFGELFFSIDSGYRGEKGKVKTQYSNLQDEGDVFANGFYVPENIYIIGTMNDIDRSVESFDFAMRRRFAWKEIKAPSSKNGNDISMWNVEIDGWKMSEETKEEAKNRIVSLNDKIESIQGLGSAFHIGPAYFLKLKNYNEDFDQLWDNHLEGVLFEYLRGLPDSEKQLIELRNAFNFTANTLENVESN